MKCFFICIGNVRRSRRREKGRTSPRSRGPRGRLMNCFVNSTNLIIFSYKFTRVQVAVRRQSHTGRISGHRHIASPRKLLASRDKNCTQNHLKKTIQTQPEQQISECSAGSCQVSSVFILIASSLFYFPTSTLNHSSAALFFLSFGGLIFTPSLVSSPLLSPPVDLKEEFHIIAAKTQH